MANHLVNIDPFADFARFDPFRTMDELMRDMRPSWSMRDMAQQQPMRIDVSESDQAYTIRADIPGVKKEDIKVDVMGNRVSINAECTRELQQEDGGRMVRSERVYGMQSRVFTLDAEIDDSQADAKYVDGVLELTLPKKAATQTRKLEIH